MSLTSQAHAATVPAPTRQMVQACEAYRTWYYSRTTAHVNAIVAATFTGDWTPTGARHILRDTTRLYADVRDDSAYKYIAAAIVAIGTDCNTYVLPGER